MLVPLLLFSAAALFYARGIIPPTPEQADAMGDGLLRHRGIRPRAVLCRGALRAALFLARSDSADAFHGYLVWGFVFYSVAQVTGAVWCYLGWGNTFQWGPRHMSSASIWLIYAAYLHLRFIPGWSGRRRAWYRHCGVRGGACTVMELVSP